jgi:hypothetical protein
MELGLQSFLRAVAESAYGIDAMTTRPAISPRLREQLDGAVRRLRLLRVVRALSLGLVVLLLTALVALMADAWLDLPPLGRRILVLAWAGLGMALMSAAVRRAKNRPISAQALAAVIEEKYPDLGERLTTTLSLVAPVSDRHEQYVPVENRHNSSNLVALLIQETEARTQRLNFLSAFPARSASRWLAAAAVGLALAMVPGVLWPERYGELARRFLLSWFGPASASQAVSSYEVAAVEPVQLLGDSPAVTITPPDYARAVIAPETVHGVTDLTALQHSRVDFDFQFARPCPAAALEWKDSAGKVSAASVNYPLELSADRRQARLRLPAVADGTFRLVMQAQGGTRTATEARALTVKIDQPPVFTRVSGTDVTRVVPFYENLPFSVELADDIGLDGAALEYRVNDAAAITEPLSVERRGSRQAHGELRFQLLGKVKEGDVVRYRFKAWDNRNLPEAGLKPQVVFHPPEKRPGEPRWRMLKIARPTEPLPQQEIAAQHDEFNEKIDALQRQLKDEQTRLQDLRSDISDQPNLKPQQARDLGDLRGQARGVANGLHELAHAAGETPALEPLADPARAIADQEMHRGDQELGRAEKETSPKPRERALQRADKELTAALQKLKDLKRRNKEIANSRLDQLKLEMLADQEQRLAERAGAKGTAEPMKDPKGQEQARDLQREQRDLASALQRATAQSETLRMALDAGRKEQAAPTGDGPNAAPRGQATQSTDRAAPAAQTSQAQMGQALQQAQERMNQAQAQLEKGARDGASQSMREAAQALTRASRNLQTPRAPGDKQASQLGAPPMDTPDLSMFGKDMKQYAGKSWGELPGELRTRIIQDMRSRYGEDYARIIKLYFEQLADRK